jgi:hypothetical protein
MSLATVVRQVKSATSASGADVLSYMSIDAETRCVFLDGDMRMTEHLCQMTRVRCLLTTELPASSPS